MIVLNRQAGNFYIPADVWFIRWSSLMIADLRYEQYIIGEENQTRGSMKNSCSN